MRLKHLKYRYLKDGNQSYAAKVIIIMIRMSAENQKEYQNFHK